MLELGLVLVRLAPQLLGVAVYGGQLLGEPRDFCVALRGGVVELFEPPLGVGRQLVQAGQFLLALVHRSAELVGLTLRLDDEQVQPDQLAITVLAGTAKLGQLTLGGRDEVLEARCLAAALSDKMVQPGQLIVTLGSQGLQVLLEARNFSGPLLDQCSEP